MHIDYYHHFQFFGKREISALYFCQAMVIFAQGMVGVFVPIYLWNIGLELWQIFFFYFILSLWFILISNLFLPVIRRLNDKIMIFASIPALILFYLGLEFLPGIPALFYLLPALEAAHMVLYNVGYHLSFTASADDGKVGREVGTSYLIQTVSGSAAPFVGGFLIVIFGFDNSFSIGSAILFLAIIPLLFFPHRNISPHLGLKKLYKYIFNKELIPFTLSGAGYATEKTISMISWRIFLLITVKTIDRLGIVMSAAGLLGSVAAYLTGMLSDAGKRRKILGLSSGTFSALWYARVLVAFSGVLVVLNEFLSVLAYSSMIAAWSSQYYKIARSVRHVTLFILSRELLYHISRALILVPMMALAYYLPTREFFLISFLFGGAVSLLMLAANREKPVRKIRGL